MSLPRALWDDVVPESTTVVGDVDAFVNYIEQGHAWKDWCGRVRVCVCWMAETFGQPSADIVEQLMQRP
jgi:hypothetical protein